MPGRRGSDGWYGRGRGGGGRSAWRRGGVGGGRGGRHLVGRGSSTNNSWVRSRDNEISIISSEESASTADSSSILTLEGGSPDASPASSAPFSKGGSGRGRGPILSGPANTSRNHHNNFFIGSHGRGRGGRAVVRGGRGGGRGRMSYHSSQSWKRDATTAAEGKNREAFVVDGSETTTVKPSSSVYVNTNAATKVQEEQSMPEQMKKVGTNKLVLSNKRSTPHYRQSGEGNQSNRQDVSSNKISEKMTPQTSSATETVTASLPERTIASFDSSVTKEGRQMIAKGRNKPVLTCAPVASNVQSTTPTATTTRSASPIPKPEKVERIAKGKNKLVSAKTVSASPQANDGIRTQHQQITNATTTNMIAKGRNKLVLAKTTDQMGSSNPRATAAIGSSNRQKEVTNATTTTTTSLIAAGSNKLVSAKLADTDKHFKSKNNAYGSNNGWRNPNSISNWEEPRKRSRSRSPANTAPTIKRIKLGVIRTAAETAKDSVGLTQEGETIRANFTDDGSTSKGKETTATKSEALTDFAYRETSSARRQPWGGGGGRFSSTRGGGGRGGGRGRGAGYNNMGLVRVNPEESKAPICPTFLRGIRCEDVRCTRRHDVPRESAMPVCSFFQRHGQCLKGSDCPFRHVKVNPLAMLCPSFNLLGYCDDDQCVMKHVAVSNKIIKKSKGR